MMSFRRALSPAFHDRSHVNGLTSDSFLVSSPSHKQLPPLSHSSSSSYSSSLYLLALGIRRFLIHAFLQRYFRKGPPLWKQAIYQFCLCFFIGLLVGFTPFFSIGKIMHREAFSLHESPPVFSLKQDRMLEMVKAEGVMAVELGTRQEPDEKLNLISENLLIIVTPTYNRARQSYYLNRLGQTLKLVAPPLLWIVVETGSVSTETSEILGKTGVMYRHLVSVKNSTNAKDRGVHQRNAALEHIEFHRLDGIVYFADDDNIYSLELFQLIRRIKRFGTWPVAMLAQGKAKTTLEGPICNETKVIGWHTNEKSKKLRRFHVDMSGFAFNSTMLWDPKRWSFPMSGPIRQLDTVKEGLQETTFIAQLVQDEWQMEGVPSGCSRILNWHLHSDMKTFSYPKGWRLGKNLDANIVPN